LRGFLGVHIGVYQPYS